MVAGGCTECMLSTRVNVEGGWSGWWGGQTLDDQWRVQDLTEGGCGLDAVGIDDIMLLSRVGHFENDVQKP